jgi:hypothetical protein
MNDILSLLPRDIKIKIISYMDIETRQKVGVIFKLQIPSIVESKLKNLFLKIVRGHNMSFIKLGPCRQIFSNISDDIESMYTLTRYFYDDNKSTSQTHYTVCHVSNNNRNDTFVRIFLLNYMGHLIFLNLSSYV